MCRNFNAYLLYVDVTLRQIFQNTISKYKVSPNKQLKTYSYYVSIKKKTFTLAFFELIHINIKSKFPFFGLVTDHVEERRFT